MNAKVFISTTGRSLVRALCVDGKWSVDTVLDGKRVNCLMSDPGDSSVVYAGTQGEGVLRSTDWGKTWQTAGMAGQVIKSIAISTSDPGAIYVGTKPPALFVSRDAGTTWTELVSLRQMRRWWWFTPAEWPPTQPYILGLALSPTNPEVIVIGIELGAVLRSADGGKTWTGHQKGAIRDCHSLFFHPTNGDWVYEGGGSGAAFSQDGGITWTQPDPMSIADMIRAIFTRETKASPQGLERRYGWAVGADPAQPDIFFCATAPGPTKAHGDKGDAQAFIYRCKAGGNWEKLAGGLPQPLDYMPYALLTDPNAPGHLYAGLSNGDVWHTTNYGDSWRQLPFNLTAIHRDLVMIVNENIGGTVEAESSEVGRINHATK